VNTLSIIGKLSAVAIAVMMLVSWQPKTASAFEPVYEIRAKNGTDLVGGPLQRLVAVLDPHNSVRVGVEMRPDLWIGYSSRHGLAMVFDF
jgi:hypothetical protein